MNSADDVKLQLCLTSLTDDNGISNTLTGTLSPRYVDTNLNDYHFPEEMLRLPIATTSPFTGGLRQKKLLLNLILTADEEELIKQLHDKIYQRVMCTTILLKK